MYPNKYKDKSCRFKCFSGAAEFGTIGTILELCETIWNYQDV